MIVNVARAVLPKRKHARHYSLLKMAHRQVQVASWLSSSNFSGKNSNRYIVTETFQEIQNSGKVKSSLKKSVTILIPKRGKDQRLVENLRPISLLDVPYKIFTKVIALRIGNVIKTCIQED